MLEKKGKEKEDELHKKMFSCVFKWDDEKKPRHIIKDYQYTTIYPT
jgi:hypothetical protein